MKPGAVVADRFEILSVAGKGAMGSVYRARDRRRGGDVALKVLHPHLSISEHLARFEREALLLAKLEHPGIVRFVAHGVDDRHSWLAMEWLEGITLSERLAQRGLDLREALDLSIRLSEALGAAHAVGVVHRDVKPSNVLLVEGDVRQVKLLDFGIARPKLAEALTASGVMLGTPGYMAPEQARGALDLGPAADLYALGCLLFKVLTGRLPFEADDPLGILLKVVLEPAPRLADSRVDVPEALDELVARLLTKDPRERPADAAALAAMLSTIRPPESSERGPQSRMSSIALTGTERRLLCLLLARQPPRRETLPSLGFDDVAHARRGERERELLVAEAARRGGTLDALADGSLVVSFSSAELATDQAVAAARTALAFQAVLPDATIAITAGSAVIEGLLPVGEVIERGVAQLANDEGIFIDRNVADLLEQRFEVEPSDGGLRLVAERAPQQVVRRTLLGKATPCVGREAELAQIDGVFAQCTEEPCARVVLVSAPAGVGKSRLRQEIAARLTAAQGVVPWLARGDALGGEAAFHLAASTLRRACQISEHDGPALTRKKVASRVEQLALPRAEELTAFLCEILGAPVSEEESPRSLLEAREGPQLMGDRLRASFEDWLSAEARRAPVALLFDDLQWADLPSLNIIDGALRNLVDSPLLVVGFARPEVHDVFPGLWVERGLTEIRLRPLSRKSSEKLVRAVLGDDVPHDTLALLLERSEGNAFYLEELIRAVAERGSSELPQSVLAMVQARLSTLDTESRRVLRAASVFGARFTRDGVRVLLGGPRKVPNLDSVLEALASAELIERRGELFSFRHALVREAVYAMLTDRDKSVGHKLAAEHLLRAQAAEPLVIAEHLEWAGEPDAAVPHYLRAAQLALEGNDLANARSRAGRGVACGATGEVRGQLRLVMAESALWAGDGAAAVAAASEALAELSPGGSAWSDAARVLSSAAGMLGQFEQVEQLAGRLEGIDPLVPRSDESAFLGAVAELVKQLLHGGALARAQELAALLERAERGATSSAVLARVHAALSLLASYEGDLSLSLRHAQLAVTRFDEAGDLRGAVLMRANLAAYRIDVGVMTQTLELLREALDGARRLGLPSAEALAHSNLCSALVRLGRFAAALPHGEAAVAGFEAIGDRRLESGSRIYLARAHLGAGQLDQAEQQALRALEVASTATRRADAWTALAEVALARGDAIAALEQSRPALELLEQLGGLDEGESGLWLVVAEAAHGAGRIADARRAIGNARARLVARAQAISDPEIRRSFLELVPENAKTLALYAAWVT